MKINRIYLLCIAFCFAIVHLNAKEITQSQANKVAKNFYYEVTASKGNTYHQLDIKESFTIKKDGITTYYAFNFEQGGFVIVSGDDVYKPIIGYNTEFSYETEDMPETLKSFFDSYSDQIIYARNHQLKSNYTEEWNRLLSDERAALNIKNRDAVIPLGAPIWNQNYPYNHYCPKGKNGRTYAGCVATAMQMVMYYWRWPFVGEGEHGYYYGQYGYLYANFAESYYDWDGMVANPRGFYHNISWMMYHIGISVDMMYGTNGSGAYSYDVPDALINHFKYKNTATHYTRNDYNGDWTQLIKDELNSGRMLYYSGCSGSGCHAFVCEGYNTDDYFYFNFGWSGTANGYYTLDVVGGYSQWQGVVAGIEPDPNKGYPYYCSGEKTVSLTNGSIADGSGPLQNYPSNITASWLIDPSIDSVPIESITVSWRELELAEGSHLRFYDGDNSSAPLLEDFSNTSTPYSFTTTGDKLFVTFTSAEATDKGFRFEYQSKVRKTCSGFELFTDEVGILTDGSDPDGFYAPSLQCMFQIYPNNGRPLKLKFNRLQLFNDDFDNISIYNVFTDTDYRLITTIKGSDSNELPEVYVETGNALIFFITNSTHNGKGWEFEWRPTAVNIEEEIDQQEFLVFPNPATDKLNITFNIENNDCCQIRLFSITGQMIYSEKVDDFYGEYNNTINTSNLEPGVYLLSLQTSAGITTKKVVIQ